MCCTQTQFGTHRVPNYNPLIINKVNGIHKLIDYLKDYRILI